MIFERKTLTYLIIIPKSPQLLTMRSPSSFLNHNLRDNLMVPLTFIIHQKLRIRISYRNSLGYLSKHCIIAIDACHVHLEIRSITCVLLPHVPVQCTFFLPNAGLVFLTSTVPRVWWFFFVRMSLLESRKKKFLVVFWASNRIESSILFLKMFFKGRLEMV